MDWITEKIALGSSDDAAFPAGVDVVLNVAAEVPVEHQLDHRHIRVSPFGPIPTNQIAAAVRYLHDNVRAGRRVLIHCSCGVSRSPSMLAAFLALEEGISAPDALLRIQGIRDVVDPMAETWASVMEFVIAERMRKQLPA